MAPPLILLALSALTFLACRWDRDTLAQEAKGRPETAEVIIGWFDRYPSRYYEMRLDRVAEEITKSPGILALYDDAGVACDCLGRYEEAIAWMERKKSIMDELPVDHAPEHRYRYLANLGTFYAHQWVSLSADQRNADLSLLKQAATLIEQAIKENPDAHFGREVYQLGALRWLSQYGTNAEYKESLEADLKSHQLISNDFTMESVDIMLSGDSNDHIDGIIGLIQLGAAWNSLDVFHALTANLGRADHGMLAELSYQRELELYESGMRSIHPVSAIADSVVPEVSYTVVDSRREEIAKFYPKAREAAKQRNHAWIQYQNERFDKGMHPDTNPEFWDEWTEPELPEFPDTPYKEFSIMAALKIFAAMAGAFLLGLFLMLKAARILIREYKSRTAAS